MARATDQPIDQLAFHSIRFGSVRFERRDWRYLRQAIVSMLGEHNEGAILRGERLGKEARVVIEATCIQTTTISSHLQLWRS